MDAWEVAATTTATIFIVELIAAFAIGYMVPYNVWASLDEQDWQRRRFKRIQSEERDAAARRRQLTREQQRRSRRSRESRCIDLNGQEA